MSYILRADSDHCQDPGYDGVVLRPKKINDLELQFLGVDKINLKDDIIIQANFDFIPEYDYPFLDTSLPIMSNRMYNYLSNLGYFKHEISNVVMLDDQSPEKVFDKNGEVSKNVKKIHSYIALHILEFSDFFDYEQSDFDEDDIFDEPVGIIRKLVLKKPVKGFPPMFRIKESPEYLFVNNEAKEKIEVNFKGCRFRKVEHSV